MSDIDLTEAVETAARGFCGDLIPAVTLDDLSAIQRHVIREQALSYVTHATPLIEAAVRAQVAREIDTLHVGALRGTRHIPASWTFALQDAARIARGGAA